MGNFSQREQTIELSQSRGGLADAPGFLSDQGAQVAEQFIFNLDNTLFCAQNLAFVLLQLGCGETLGTHKCLLTLVAGGNQFQIGFRNLDVVAKDVVELDFQILNPACGPARATPARQ